MQGPSSYNIVTQLIIIAAPGQGLFVYSPTEGTGNLIVAITAGSGADAFGNQYIGDVNVINDAANIQSDLNAAGLEVLTSSLTTLGDLEWDNSDSTFYLSAPISRIKCDPIKMLTQVAVPGAASNGSTLYSNANGTASAIEPGGDFGALPLSHVDSVSFSNLLAVSPLSDAWNIGVPEVNTTYTIRVMAQQGSYQGNSSFNFSAFGLPNSTNPTTNNFPNPANGTGWSGYFEMNLTVRVVDPAVGVIYVWGFGHIYQTAGLAFTTAVNATYTGLDTSATTQFQLWLAFGIGVPTTSLIVQTNTLTRTGP